MFSKDCVRSFPRSCVVAVLIAGLLDFPALAAFPASGAPTSGDKALGVVIQSQVGRLGQSNLTIGTSVYSGDSLWTDTGGTLRLKIGSGQLYLLASSGVTLGQEESAVQAALTRGTAGFSVTPTDRLELLIPQGIVRAASGQSAYGQVTLISPTEVVVSVYRGALVLDNVGELHTIGAGSSYRVTILPDVDSQQPEGATTPEYPQVRAKKRKRLVFALIMMAGAAIGSYFAYEELTESPSKMDH